MSILNNSYPCPAFSMTFEAATCSLILCVLDGLYDGGNDNLVDDEQQRNERGIVRRSCRKE